jgi:hypothetical protein
MEDDDGIGIDTGVGSDLIEPAVALALTFDHGPLDQPQWLKTKGSHAGLLVVLLFGLIQLDGQGPRALFQIPGDL